MPRYFFHLTDGCRTYADAAGVELPDISATRQYATEQTRQLRRVMSEPMLQAWSCWKVIAADSIGNTVYEIGFDHTPPSRA